ncbi:MAG: anaerobic sulfatase maturase [Herbinix sp.]|nr:anaerobic sulfatase maturase [Herbinix sp.]
MPNQTILIKPVSGSCNLNCDYCFYYDVMNHRAVKNYGFMTLESLEQIVIKSFQYADQFVGFAFQGGEPTLAGLPFYEKLMEYIHKYNTRNIAVSLSMQTNGIAIDREWAEFFKKNNFLIGISMDGPKEIHNLNRKDRSGEGSFLKVQRAVQILTHQGVEFNVLCVVTKDVAQHATKVYQFYKRNRIQYIQFIPCLDDFDERQEVKSYTLLPEDYGKFLCNLFDLWYQDFKRGERISIRMFDNILFMLLGEPPESCDMNGVCSANAVIEGDGSVYPCDFYVLDQYLLGNIHDHGFEELKSCKVASDFVSSSNGMDAKCKGCKFLYLCRTGCRRHKVSNDQDTIGKNYFCSSYEMFYEYTLSRFREVAICLTTGKRR